MKRTTTQSIKHKSNIMLRISARHKFTGTKVTLYYPSIAQAQARNKAFTDFEIIGGKRK